MAKKKIKANSLKSIYDNIIYPRRKSLLLGFLLIIINRLSGLVLPWSTKYLIDDMIAPKSLDLLGPFILIVGVAVLISALSSYALTQLLSVQAQK